MKKSFVLVAMALFAMLFTQCAKKATSASKATTATDEVAEMKKKYSGEQIADGKVVYTLNCQKCHKLYEPGEFTIKQWNRILPEMSQKAALTADQAGKVRAWVVINSKK